MTPERWNKLAALFHAARDLPVESRQAFLEKECGQDRALYNELLRWLEEDVKEEGPLDHPVWVQLGRETESIATFSPDDLIGGRYRIIRFIERVGMGEVYEAEDLELKGRVALKLLAPHVASDPRMIVRFKQEVKLSRRVAHPNVCKVFDIVRHPPGDGPIEFWLLSMEYLAGETLAKRLRRTGRMPPRVALGLVRQMAAGLDAAHAEGVIHRDFKPSNVMLVSRAGSSRAVITDFGLAREVKKDSDSTVTVSAALMGTLDYMAPELLTGGEAGVASDIYAFGMTIYKMLTGTRPFPDDVPLSSAVRRSREPVPPPASLVAGLDERWNAAVMRCLDHEPSRRFASASKLIEAVQGDSVQQKAHSRMWGPPLDVHRYSGLCFAGYRLHRAAPTL